MVGGPVNPNNRYRAQCLIEARRSMNEATELISGRTDVSVAEAAWLYIAMARLNVAIAGLSNEVIYAAAVLEEERQQQDKAMADFLSGEADR